MSEGLYCPIKNSQCSVTSEMLASPMCFIAIPFRDEMKDSRRTVVEVLKKYSIQPYLADEDVTTGRDILCKICEKITFSDFGVIELTSVNPNVMLEFGVILGRRKPVFILYNKRAESSPKYIPVDIIALDRIEYSNQEILAEKFEEGIKQYQGRLDRKKKELQTMMQLARSSARDREFATTDKLLDIIFERMEVEKGKDGRFITLLQEVATEVNDPALSMRYSLALARSYAMQKDIGKSVSCAKDIIDQRSSIIKSMLQKAEELVDKSALEKVMENEKKLLKDPFFAVFEVTRPRNFDSIFPYIWMLVGKSQNPGGLIASIARMIKKDYFVGRGRMAYPFRTKLWDTNQLGFDMISFLNVFAEIYPNKKSAEVKQAKNLLSSIDDVLAHYYDIV